MKAFEQSFLRSRPDLVLVVGDVTSTFAAALVAIRMEIPVAHVEAGLRSFDRRMPEEVNRLVTDTLSDYLFVTEPSGIQNLRTEDALAAALDILDRLTKVSQIPDLWDGHAGRRIVEILESKLH